MEKQPNYNEICKPIVDNKVFPYLFETDGSDFLINIGKMTETEYITSLLVLRFDDNIGQIAEQVWPPESLDHQTIKQLSSLGFPETNSLKQDGEIEFVFKVRQSKHNLIIHKIITFLLNAPQSQTKNSTTATRFSYKLKEAIIKEDIYKNLSS